MEKVDYKKDFKALYLPKSSPDIITVPTFKFIILAGTGDPNQEEFAQALAALYSLSYAVKMSYKSSDVPKDYYQYTVFPLEGEWDLADKTLSPTDKSNYKYEIMIRQPEFLTDELFARFLAETKKKKPNPYLERVRLILITEGLCCQMMHIGSYDDEPASFAVLDKFCLEKGYKRSCHKHREIYLSDPRKTKSHKLKTVLRYKVEAKPST